ncbi:MAG: hypothetical protein JXB26_09410 [Candidatus Aminicenantes bacterium]|nr:hypothetical protein [Candidatus Aminicenantes bacterium]
MILRTRISLAVCFFLFLAVFVHSQQPEGLITQGDEIFNSMGDMEAAKQALTKYEEAEKLLENKYDALWRISRVMYYIGYFTEKKKEKKKIFQDAVLYANKAVILEPEKPDGHYWQGVNNGKYGETRGVFKSLSLVKPIKAAMNKVIELDRNYEEGGADRVLGRVYYKLPGIAGGSNDKSLEHLLKSKELGPEDALTRVYLAETYLDMKEVEKAREELEYVLAMEDDPCWVTMVNECKNLAREILKDKKFRK